MILLSSLKTNDSKVLLVNGNAPRTQIQIKDAKMKSDGDIPRGKTDGDDQTDNQESSAFQNQDSDPGTDATLQRQADGLNGNAPAAIGASISAMGSTEVTESAIDASPNRVTASAASQQEQTHAYNGGVPSDYAVATLRRRETANDKLERFGYGNNNTHVPSSSPSSPPNVATASTDGIQEDYSDSHRVGDDFIPQSQLSSSSSGQGAHFPNNQRISVATKQRDIEQDSRSTAARGQVTSSKQCPNHDDSTSRPGAHAARGRAFGDMPVWARESYRRSHGAQNHGGESTTNTEGVRDDRSTDELHDSTDISTSNDLAEDEEDAQPTIGAEIVDEEAVRAKVQAKIEEKRNATIIEASDVQVISPESRVEGKRRIRPTMVVVSLVVSGCALVALIFAIVTLNIKSRDGQATQAPAPLPTLVSLRDILKSNFPNETFHDKEAPQYQALEWMTSNDTLWPTLNLSTTIERYTIAVLYFSTNGPTSWSTKIDFLRNESLCSWPPDFPAIICDDSGSVDSIIFDHVFLNGTIPSEISSLSALEEFTVVESALWGTIPIEFGLLSRLERLVIKSSSLTGRLPESLSGLRKLEILDLSENKLTGTIPQHLTQISGLVSFSLSNTRLSGTIPEFDASSMPDIERILLDDNELEGTVPLSIYNLTSLVELSLESNSNLTGSIPAAIGRMKSLARLDFRSCNITGTLPSELGMLTNLKVLAGSHNNIWGTIPTEVFEMERLEELLLEGNSLSGTLPSEMSNLNRLDTLELSFNLLSGLVPENLTSTASLVNLRLSNNRFAPNALEPLCTHFDESNFLFAVSADCYGNDPKVDCPCCASCYDEAMGEVVWKPDIGCKLYAKSFEVLEDRSMDCTCLDGGYTLSCTEGCMACDHNRSICVQRRNFTEVYDSVGAKMYTESTFRYAEGRNDEVLVHYNWNADASDNVCRVFLNGGQECESCTIVRCMNNFQAVSVICDNVDGVGNYNPCNEFDADGTVDNGPLSLFALQDPFLRDGCAPWFTLHLDDW